MANIPLSALPYALPVNCKLLLSPNIEILASAHIKTGVRFNDIPGIAENRQEVKLRLVQPKLLPADIKVGTRLLTEITDTSTSVITKYTAIVTRIIQSQWGSMTAKYGALLVLELIQEVPNIQVDNENPFGGDAL